MEFNVASLLKEITGASRVYEIDDDIVVDGARPMWRARYGWIGRPKACSCAPTYGRDAVSQPVSETDQLRGGDQDRRGVHPDVDVNSGARITRRRAKRTRTVSASAISST